MQEKVTEAEDTTKKSKAKSRVGAARGQWWPCELKEKDLLDLQNEGFLKADSWRFVPKEPVPAPKEGERVITKALVERGFSFPPSDFFIELLKHYGLQPHNIPPNSILAISNFVTLCEGHLGIPPNLELFKYFYCIKKETVGRKGPLANCGSVTFKLRDGRAYPSLEHHESARYWSSGFFYHKDVTAPGRSQGLPPFKDGAPFILKSWSTTIPQLYLCPDLGRMARRIAKLVSLGLSGQDLTLSWFTRRIQPLQHRDRLMCKYVDRHDSLRVTEDNLTSDALDMRVRKMFKVPKDVHTYTCVRDIYVNDECPLVSFRLTLPFFTFSAQSTEV